MNGGYFLVDCTGLNLANDTAQSIAGIWDKAKTALAVGKPIVCHNCIYGAGKLVSPVTCFGWQIADDEIVIVGATLHIHIKDDNTATVLDVVPSQQAKGGKK